MEMSYEEKLQLENSKEHLQTVLANIRTANKELERVHREIKIPIDEKNRVEALIIQLRENNLVEYLKGVSLEQTVYSLTNQIKDLSEKERELSTKITKQTKLLEDNTNKLLVIKSKNEDIIRTQEDKIKLLKAEIISLREEKRSNEKESREQSSIKKSIENEITRLNTEAEKAQKDLDRFRKDSAKEIESINGLIEKEKDKIRNPLKLLGEENDKLDKRFNELAIIKSRLIKQYLKQNPDRILPLELQDKQKNGNR